MSSSEEEKPQDLGLVIVSKEEKLWSDLLEKVTAELENLEKAIKIQTMVKEATQNKLNEARQVAAGSS